MALSGSFTGSIASGKYKLRVDWSATQSVANNTSKITADMYLVLASGWDLDINARSGNTTYIAGTTHTWSSPAIDKSGGTTTKLATVTSGNISHNANGTKSVTITATFYIRATISGTYYEKITASQTVTLNTIPRATTPTLSATSVHMGDSVTISMPRASSSFTHDIAYSFAGSVYNAIATGAGTSYTFTVPDLTYAIPNKTSGTMSIRCITKNGSTTIGTKYVELTAKVPRATKPTLSASSVDMGSTVTFSLPRASSSFRLDLAYSFAGSVFIAVENGFTGATYPWAIPDLAYKIPNDTSGTLTFRCITWNGTAKVGTETVLLTIKVPTGSAYSPSISSVTAAEQTSGLAAQFGAFIQNKSMIKTTITAAGAAGSTIRSYSTTFAGKTYTGNSWTSGIIAQSGSMNMVTTVTDSRGRTASRTTTISVLPYEKPKITAFKAARGDANGAQTDDGIYALLTASTSVASLGERNTASMKVEWKKSTDTVYNETPLMTSSALVNNLKAHKIESPTFSVDYQYDLRLTLSDWFGESEACTYVSVLPSGDVILDVKADGTGLAFFKTADQAGVDFGASAKGAVLGLRGASVSIPSNANLNDYTKPGVYAIESNAIMTTLENRPCDHAGTLRVWSSTGVEHVEGAYAYITQEFRSYDNTDQVFQRTVNSDSEGVFNPSEWRPTSLRTRNRVLWSGAYYMNSNHTVNLSEPVSAQPSGVVLFWSPYQNGTALGKDYIYTFVPKEHVRSYDGDGAYVLTYDAYAGIAKRVLVHDTQVIGDAQNVTSSGTLNGITYRNTGYVLRAVIGV